LPFLIMVTVPVGRFWSFCFCAAVLGVMTLNPEATSMLSLFCEVLCVLAQRTKSAAHPAAILLRKRYVVSFIDSDLSWYQIDGTFAIIHSHPLKPGYFSCFQQIGPSPLDVGGW